MAEVELRNISKKWGEFVGVADFNLTIADREFLVLLGPSGCGKTTTMRMIAGLEEASGGDILIDGQRVNDLDPKDRDVAMVFQSYALYPNMNVYENIRFPLKVRRIPKEEHDARVRRASAMVELDEFLNRRPAELSGGQRQRVALARAIVREPNVFLMDEPLSNLDAKLRTSVRKDIKKLQRDLGITVVYVTHDQTEAMSMADTVVLMKDGTIQQVGPPEELYNKPNNTFVAEFVGAPAMALISSDGLSGFEAGQRLGIRAENIQIVPKGEGRLTCTITESEFLGSETLIGLDHAHATGLCVLKSGMALMPEGDTIDITFTDEHLHVFDASGQRIATQT